VTWPLTKRGVPSKTHQVKGQGYTVEQLGTDVQTQWQTITLRPTARGMLVADFARRGVWTVRADGRLVAETVLMRRDGKRITYSLSNADPTAPLRTLAERKSRRYSFSENVTD
jgi:hypothetical protein